MNRRELLKNGLMAGALSFVPFTDVFAGTKMMMPDPEEDLSGFKKLKLGALELFVLTDGYIREKNIDTFSPRADVPKMKTMLRDHFRSDQYVDLAMNLMLVKTKDRLILLDSGMGIFADEKTNFLLKSLQKAGFYPKDITDVFISHAHPDHIGGVVDQQNNLVFPNANLYISKVEYDFWLQASIKDFKNSFLKKQPELLNQVIPAIQNVLKTIRPKLKFYDFDKPLYDHFNFRLSPGHTPGLTVVSVDSGNEKLIYIADLVHSDVVLFPHPDWGFSGDTDLDIATESRTKMLGYLAETKAKAFAGHLPWPGLGFTKKKGDGYEWIPESFMN
ncbi:MBL fold metallo-hydrolase [Chryseobacterium carnipullorum]|uniref:MBL fold metallo-hydrolase n=1 Tax=Chryseobacterium carnipullorum TaxID=1124835 RepID=UPI000932D495|nr:MBL fold metallo-hydrolase [Chryseobacterium carnipullorum]